MSEAGTPLPVMPSDAYDRTLLGRLDRRLLGSPAARWGLLALFVLAFGAASVKFVRNIRTVEVSVFRGEKRKTALGRWLADPQALAEGGDPYGPGHWFPNPPLVLLALSPLSALPVEAAAALWLAGKFAAVLGALALMMAAVRRAELAVPVGVVLMCALFSVRPIVGDVQHGNINIFVLFEVALVWYLFVQRRDVACGLILGLAITTKVTPALLLVYFLYKRSWRVVGGTALGLLVFVIVVPGLILGFDRNAELLAGWFNMMVRPYVLEGWVALAAINQSLPGTLMKWFAAPQVVAMQWPSVSLGAAGDLLRTWFPVEMTTQARGHCTGSMVIDVMYQAWHQVRLYEVPLRTGMPVMARPDALLPAAVLRGAGLAVLALLAWACRTRSTERRDPRLLLELSLVLLAMLLLSERTWKHHMCTLMIVFLAQWQVLACYPWSRRFRALFVSGLVIQLLFLQVRGDIALYIGVITMGLLLCFAQNIMLLRRMGRLELEAEP